MERKGLLPTSSVGRGGLKHFGSPHKRFKVIPMSVKSRPVKRAPKPKPKSKSKSLVGIKKRGGKLRAHQEACDIILEQLAADFDNPIQEAMQSIATQRGLHNLNMEDDPSAPYRLMENILAGFTSNVVTWEFNRKIPQFQITLTSRCKSAAVYGVVPSLSATTNSHLMVLSTMLSYIKLSRRAGEFL